MIVAPPTLQHFAGSWRSHRRRFRRVGYRLNQAWIETRTALVLCCRSHSMGAGVIAMLAVVMFFTLAGIAASPMRIIDQFSASAGYAHR
ncbi:hypothetical protein [Ancylobacter sp. SL191]|uniref:hypothetical protein n=1 Tax=Ancylobacter sp. SL191 TaxID=2995166 RepID=UPI00226FD8DC|nr:hypothetical protein [Ancylobacter sp. SL191]WAC26254.1 hypothetical protein OU996_14695 [Ancylobacter sp. SL191]